MYQGTQITAAAQKAINQQFLYRHVCDRDLFGYFFNREVLKLQDQFNQYLALNATKWDPMVADYMEREIEDTYSKISAVDSTKNSTTTRNSSGQSTDSGQDSTNVENSSHGLVKDTSASNSQTLQGSTPDSALYPEGGFPENLKWKYASAQGEQKDSGTNNSESSGGGTVDTTVKYGRINNTVGEGTEKVTGSDGSTGRDDSNNLHRERYTGRHEAPQDLMDRALSYILKSNALEWIVKRLDTCFFGMYNFDWEV